MSDLPDVVAATVQSIVSQSQALGLTWTLRLATVVSSTQVTGLIILFDGDTATIAAVNMTGDVLSGGDRVYAIAVPQSGNFVIGHAEILGLCRVARYTGGAFIGNTASGSFSDMPAPPQITIRVQESSALLLTLQTSCYTDAPFTSVQFGFNVNGTDYTAVNFFFNQASVHLSMGGQRVAQGLPAGITTITGRWRVSGGGGTIFSDNNDWVSMTALTVAVA